MLLSLPLANHKKLLNNIATQAKLRHNETTQTLPPNYVRISMKLLRESSSEIKQPDDLVKIEVYNDFKNYVYQNSDLANDKYLPNDKSSLTDPIMEPETQNLCLDTIHERSELDIEEYLSDLSKYNYWSEDVPAQAEAPIEYGSETTSCSSLASIEKCKCTEEGHNNKNNKIDDKETQTLSNVDTTQTMELKKVVTLVKRDNATQTNPWPARFRYLSGNMYPVPRDSVASRAASSPW